MKAVYAWMASMLVAGAACAAHVQLKSGAFEPPRMAPELGLAGSDGKPLELARYRGKVADRKRIVIKRKTKVAGKQRTTYRTARVKG